MSVEWTSQVRHNGGFSESTGNQTFNYILLQQYSLCKAMLIVKILRNNTLGNPRII